MASVPPAVTGSKAQTVLRLAREMGFALVGIAPAEPAEYAEELRRWLGEGRQGEMDYLAKQAEALLDVRRLVPGAKAVICVADRYPSGFGFGVSSVEEGEEGQGPRAAGQAGTQSSKPATRNPQLPTGRVARYAWGHDYHWVIKKRLHALADELRGFWPEHEYRSCVDTAPVLEREYARRAGIGWVGKNTMVLHPEEGSWLMLGEIVTTLPLQTAEDAGLSLADHCGTCTRCLEACPTQCLTPYEIDARRCISYLTIEHHSLIEVGLHEAMGDWVAGCDVCQEVCPFNQVGQGPRAKGQEHTQNARLETRDYHPDYTPRAPAAPGFSLLEVLGWTAADRERNFWKSPLKRIKLEQMKRNALIAAGNCLQQREDAGLRRRIAEMAEDAAEAAVVRETARQVLGRAQRAGG